MRHPETEIQLIHVIPSNWGPFVDIRACLQSLARRRPWTHVISPAEYKARMAEPIWQDPSRVFVCWDLGTADPGPKEDRGATVLAVYSEALDERGASLLPAHLAHWHRYKDIAHHFDAVLAHTPWMAGMVARAGTATHVMPVGWDEVAMGSPRWDAPKHRGYLYYGSLTGRRSLLMPFLRSHAGALELVDITGSFGRGVLAQLDTASASLYIAHSSVASFSTWRMWQTASTSAAMVAEDGDAWPFEAKKHYVPFGPFTLDNADTVVGDLVRIVHEHDMLQAVANEAHALARQFTVDLIEDRYLMPAAVAAAAVRRR